MNSPHAGKTPGHLPASILRHLDGENLDSKIDEAIQLVTVTADGWPHATHLSAGEVLALDAERIAFALWPNSGAAGNIDREPRVTLSLVSERAICEVRLLARRLGHPESELALFMGTVVSCRVDRAPYADVLRGVTFRLHDAPGTLVRWRNQIALLRSLAG